MVHRFLEIARDLQISISCQESPNRMVKLEVSEWNGLQLTNLCFTSPKSIGVGFALPTSKS